MADNLVSIICNKCGREICRINTNIYPTKILCPKCKKWIERGDMPDPEEQFFWKIINKRKERLLK